MKIFTRFYEVLFRNVGKVLDVCVKYVELGGFKNCMTAILLCASVTWPALLLVMWIFMKLCWWIF